MFNKWFFFVAFVDFHCINTPTIADCKYILMMSLNLEVGREIHSCLSETSASQPQYTACWLLIFDNFLNFVNCLDCPLWSQSWQHFLRKSFISSRCWNVLFSLANNSFRIIFIPLTSVIPLPILSISMLYICNFLYIFQVHCSFCNFGLLASQRDQFLNPLVSFIVSLFSNISFSVYLNSFYLIHLNLKCQALRIYDK